MRNQGDCFAHLVLFVVVVVLAGAMATPGIAQKPAAAPSASKPAPLIWGDTVPSIANARDDEPSPEVIKEFAFNYMRQLSQQKLSDREIANQLASTIIWLEKLQVICPSYYYVNARRARFDYLLRQGTWAMMFGPGKTSTSIMNEAS